MPDLAERIRGSFDAVPPVTLEEVRRRAVRRPSTTRRRVGLVGAIAFSAVVVATTTLVAARATSGGHGARIPPATASTPTTTRSVVVTPEVVAAVQPPSGFQVFAMAADVISPGLWYLAGNSSDVSLFHWDDGTARLTRYSLGSPKSDTALQIGELVGLAVTADHVWVGSRDTLFELDPNTRLIRSVAVPTPTDNPSVEEHRPPSVKGYHGIESISVSPANGHVAVAMEAVESVAVYDPDAGSFSTIRLPESDEPLSVAYATDGTLAVSAVAWPSGSQGIVDLVPPSGGSIERLTTDVGYISSDGSSILGTATTQVVRIDPAGPGGPSTTALYSTAAPPAAGALDSDVAAVAGPGAVVAGTTNGLVVLRAGQIAKRLGLPSVTCVPTGPGPDPSPTSSTAPTRTTCQVVATQIAIDTGGNIWLTENFGGSISEIEAGSY
jgi:hypothetical protein